MYPVKFIPVPMERIWGGHDLKSWFHVDTEKPIGEYWVVSGHPNAKSIVAEGPLAGTSLNELTQRYPKSYLGHSPQPRFPLLIKFLEAETDLSVQIHPDDIYAKAHEGDYGKTEAWVVLDAANGGQVNLGHTFASRSVYEKAVAESRVRDYLSYRPIKQGDLVFVPARTLHALLAGTKVLEIQQTSDVTYRVYDWDRVDASGHSRELHVDKAADVLEYGVNPQEQSPIVVVEREGLKITRLVSCPYFSIDSCVIMGSGTFHLGKNENPDVVVVIKGSGTLTCDIDGTGHVLPLELGDAVLIPSEISEYTVAASSASGSMSIVRTFYG